MKEQYDFTRAERGRFYKPNVDLNIPIYLAPDALTFVEQLARKKESDLSSVVNDLIRADMGLAAALE